MRFILLIIFIVYQINCYSQKFNEKYDSVIYEEQFMTVNTNWEQRSSATDFAITEEGYYIFKNKNSENFTVSLHKPSLNLFDYSVSTSFKTDASKSIENSLGLMLNATADGTGAIICEINSKGQYRVRKFNNGQWQILSFTGDNGWNRSKAIKTKSLNEITIISNSGIFDFYINSTFIFSFIEKKYTMGNIGIFAGKNSSGKVDFIKVLKKSLNTILPSQIDTTSTQTSDNKEKENPKSGKNEDNEVILLLKSKIDKQQKKITELTYSLERCRKQKSSDTTLEIKNIELSQMNETLMIEKGKLEIELKKAKDKLAELEILKKAIEDDKNGDIILSLNDIINREKKKNDELSKKLQDLKTENQQLLNIIKELKKEK